MSSSRRNTKALNKKLPDIYSLLMLLDDSEWGQFLIYGCLTLEENSDIRKLQAYLSTNRNHLPPLDRVQKELFPRSTKKNVSNKLHLIKILLEEYWSWRQFQREKGFKGLCLLSEYLNQGLYGRAKKVRTKLLKNFSKRSAFDINCHLYTHLLLHKSIFSYSDEFYDSAEHIISLSSKSLNNYTRNWLMVYQTILLRRESYKLKDKKEFFLPKEYDCEILKNAVDTYHEFISTESKESFLRLYKYVNNYLSNENSEFILICHQLLISQARKMVISDSTYSDLLIHLYQRGIDLNLFIIQGYFSDLDFTLIINAGCALGKLDWAEAFLTTRIKYLNPNFRVNHYHLGMADLCLYRLEFDKSLDHIEMAGSSGKINELKYRWIKLINLMSLRRRDFDSFAHSVYVYIGDSRRHTKINNIESTKNLIKLCKKVYLRANKEEILNLINSDIKVAKKSWFRQNVIWLLDY